MIKKPSRLRFAMWKIYNFFFIIPLLFFGETLEVPLTTQTQLKPLILTTIHSDPSFNDWRYLDELRNTLEFDLNLNGFCSVQTPSEELEDHLDWPDTRKNFDISFWKSQKTPYLITLQIINQRLVSTAFDLQKESSKKYPEVFISGKTEEDRKAMHRLSDAITKDLFGVEGIASLRILYSQRTKHEGQSYQSEIWMCDADGHDTQQLTQDGAYSLTPGFFPKTTPELEFYYVSYAQGQSKIYRRFLSQKESRTMITLRGNQALPAISKKGNLFAFITDVAGRPDLFLQSLDKGHRLLGKARQIYSQPRATQASPTFSPDGKKIAFVSDKDGPPRIYWIEVPAPQATYRIKPHLITTKNRENTSPAWSPDGTKIAYSARTEGVRQIWVCEISTGEEKQLTTGPENKENPSWASDNLHLIYNTESEDVCELYILNLNEPQPVCISKGPGQKRFPCWEPR